MKPKILHCRVLAFFGFLLPLGAVGQTNCDPTRGLIDASCPEVSKDVAKAEAARRVGPRGLRLSPLEVHKDVDVGCGCYFHLLGNPPPDGIFLAWTTSEPVMRLNGKLLKLRITDQRGTERRIGVKSVGDSRAFELVASNVTVNFKGQVTSYCEGPSTQCEGEESFEGSMSVSMGSRSHAFRARGSCGC